MTVLRGGAEVPDSLVPAVMTSLRRLMEENPVALYELTELARDPSHQLFRGTGKVLWSLSLIGDDGKLRDPTRAVILAAAEGEGLTLRLRSPYAEGAHREGERP